MNSCRSCPAPILWAIHKKTGKRNPLDTEPTPEGNLLVTRDQEKGVYVYEVLTGEELAEARRQTIALYISHFATCPRARSHRRATEHCESSSL